jgi:hypothetical protein
MRKPSLEWAEVSQLIAELGSEKYFAKRLKSWRGSMSLDKLSKALDDSGHFISKSALSRMENMDAPGRPNSRRKQEITIGDALAISRIFNKSLVSMLLPDEALEEHAGWVAILEATEALGRVQQAWLEYREHIDNAQSAMWKYDGLRERVEDELADTRNTFRKGNTRDWESMRQHRIKIGDPVPSGEHLEAWLNSQPPTRELMALEDSLASTGIDTYGWIKSDRRQQSHYV